jgi:FkbM family methyltransferase
MLRIAKNNIKKLFYAVGLDLHRLSPASNLSHQLLTALNYVQADVVFDIGANIGQFAQELRLVGFGGKIISFDPLTSAHAQLCESARNDSKWTVHPRAAVGDHDGEIEINIAGNSVSSSVLPMLDAHSSAAVGSAYVASERTPLIRLDTVAEQYLSVASRPFIKIDTQGFEWQVLEGATETLKRAQGVLLELSLVPLYDGQRLWREIIERMETEGFTLWAIQKGFTDPRTGRSLQVDGIFLRQ